MQRFVAPAQILAAQKALDDLLFQQRQQQLEAKAVQEQKAHDASIKREQDTFAKRLKVILDEGGNIGVKLKKL